MAKLTRQTLLQFGSTGATSNFGQFGSQAAGAPVTTKTIATIQSLAAWLSGIQSAVAAGQAPYLQDFNSLFYVLAYEMCYTLQEGVVEWDSGTNYFIGSIVKRPSAPEYYSSLIDNNLNQALPTAGTSNSNWQFLSGFIASSFRVGGPIAMNSQKITGAAPSTATGDVAIYDQIINLTRYRRPTLTWGGSGTIVGVEAGIDGTAGEVMIIFPDGTVLTDTTSGDYNCDLTRVAAFASGTIQSGLYSGSAAANTWYSFYAVKVTKVGSTTRFVTVAIPLEHKQANYATLNSNFGTNGWVYLGTVPYGDNSGNTTAVPKFFMAGAKVCFYNSCNGMADNTNGVRLASATATSVTWSYAAGTALGSGQVPSQIVIGDIEWEYNSGGIINVGPATPAQIYMYQGTPTGITNGYLCNIFLPLGIKSNPGASLGQSIALAGFIDSALGSGSFQLL